MTGILHMVAYNSFLAAKPYKRQGLAFAEDFVEDFARDFGRHF